MSLADEDRNPPKRYGSAANYQPKNVILARFCKKGKMSQQLKFEVNQWSCSSRN